jgi:hypothetical protein
MSVADTRARRVRRGSGLLRADAEDDHGALLGAIRCGCGDLVVAPDIDDGEVAVGVTSRSRLDWPRKLATNAVRGQVVEHLGRTHLLDPAEVHHRDRVGHGHGLLLVVGDVDEGQPDLGLDPLELDLHLAAQLEVQRAERLVEQEHLGAVDQARATATRCC